MRANTDAAAEFAEQEQVHLPHVLWESSPSPSPGEHAAGHRTPRAAFAKHTKSAHLIRTQEKCLIRDWLLVISAAVRERLSALVEGMTI